MTWLTSEECHSRELEVINFNSIPSAILKWFRFKFKILALLSNGLGLEIKACILPKAGEIILNYVK
jgi:hypothetical protein